MRWAWWEINRKNKKWKKKWTLEKKNKRRERKPVVINIGDPSIIVLPAGWTLKTIMKCKEEVLEPEKKVKVPIVVDDGTLRIRGVLWDQTLKKLAGKGVKLAEIFMADFQRAYEMIKELLLGREILVRGYVVQGDFGLELRISDADFVTKLEPELKFIKVTK